jgi:acyl carrier protein
MSSTTDTEATIRREIRTFVEENFLYLRPDLQLQDGDPLLELGVIDSLGFVELVEEVQSRYGVAVDDIEITEENFGSIEAIARFAAAKRAA